MGAAMVNQISPLEASGGKAMTISLLYHDVVEPGQFASSGFPDKDADIYKLERQDFELHLDTIARDPAHGKIVVCDSPKQEMDSQALLFTFDDGGATALTIATLLEERGWRGHFFISTDYVGKPAFLGAKHLRELRVRGHVVGSHSCSHPLRMSHCGQAQLEYEWAESARVLSDILGEKLRVASVPGGDYSRRVAEAAAAAGIEVLFNSEPTCRVTQVGGCKVLGRYAIMQGVSAYTAAQIASGEWAPCLQQYLLWNSKKIAKRMGGESYLRFRKWFLNQA